jgi:hypothetical protein
MPRKHITYPFKGAIAFVETFHIVASKYIGEFTGACSHAYSASMSYRLTKSVHGGHFYLQCMTLSRFHGANQLRIFAIPDHVSRWG